MLIFSLFLIQYHIYTPYTNNLHARKKANLYDKEKEIQSHVRLLYKIKITDQTNLFTHSLTLVFDRIKFIIQANN